MCVCVCATLGALCVLIMLSILGMHGLEVTGLRPRLNKKKKKNTFAEEDKESVFAIFLYRKKNDFFFISLELKQCGDCIDQEL